MHALDDIDVLSLESGISAPLCTRMLGDFGAEVVKVERPGVGDVNRHWDSTVHGESSAHVWVDRNKKSIELDLKSEAGNQIFLDLATKADIVVQNYSPGVVDRLGIGYEDVKTANDDVIYVNVSGYGRDGPYEEQKAYDMVMQGETGLILMNGSPDSPAKIPLSICDINAAMYATIGSMTALLHREWSGEGQEIDVTMFGGILSWLGYFTHKYWHDDDLPERVGIRHHLLTPYGPHETSDKQFINFAVLSRSHWQTFCEDVIDRPELADDPRYATNEDRMDHREEVESMIEEMIAKRPRDYWAERLQDAGIPWGDVNQIDEVLNHPQTDHLDLVKELETDEGVVKFIDNPIDFEKFEHQCNVMPDLGEHTESVLADLGYDDEEIEQFREDEVV